MSITGERGKGGKFPQLLQARFVDLIFTSLLRSLFSHTFNEKFLERFDTMRISLRSEILHVEIIR